MPRILARLFCLPFILFTLGASADVYRAVDADGNVVFSDTPMPGAEKIEISEPTIVPSAKISAPRRTEKLSPEPNDYASVQIVAPADEQTFRNVERIDVQVAVTPPLEVQMGDRLQLYVDGSAHGEAGTATQFTIEQPERGEHRLEVAVVGPAGEAARSESVVIFVHQPSQFIAPQGGPGPGS